MIAVPSPNSRSGLRIAGWRSVMRSHVGRVRTINEDRVLDANDQGCWAVADGMGGHNGGDFAAQTVVDQLRFALLRDPFELAEALQRANEVIFASNQELRRQSGTTVVAAMAEKNRLRVLWAGDSRAYLIRKETTILMTHDHSLVQELVDANLLSLAAAVLHPQANVVTRALGINPIVELETVEFGLEPGDRILLCSDGLSRSMNLEKFDREVSLQDLATQLMDTALDNDGTDNISLVLAEPIYPAD